MAVEASSFPADLVAMIASLPSSVFTILLAKVDAALEALEAAALLKKLLNVSTIPLPPTTCFLTYLLL